MTTSIIPVIHYKDHEQARRNAARAFDAGCDGVLLIHMEGRNALLPVAARDIKARWPHRLVGINHLGADPLGALHANAGWGLDMTWTDDQPTHSEASPWPDADELSEGLRAHPGHTLFVGVAFKHQRHEPDPGAAAAAAVRRGFVPTTSGPATGVPGDVGSVRALRDAIGPDAPLGIASGITPGNAAEFAPHLSHILVATGVSSSFHEFDEALLADLVSRIR